MKQLLLFPILFVFSLGNHVLYAQPVTTTVTDDTYGTGGTKVTTVEDNGLGMKTTTEEFYNNDKPPKLREKIIRIKDRIGGDSTVKSFDFAPNGIDTTNAREKVFRPEADGSYKLIYAHSVYYKNGNPKGGVRSVHLPDGTIEESEFNEKAGQFEVKKKKGWEVIPQKSKSFTLSLGYSFLNTSNDGNSESFPVGGFLTLAYFLNTRLALLGDVSIHSKKDEELRTTLIFLMGGLQYNLLRERQKAMMLYSRLLIGIALDKQKYSIGNESNTNKASAFALAASLGAYFPIFERMSLNLAVDYIRTHFNSDGQNNIRAGAGIKILLGNK